MMVCRKRTDYLFVHCSATKSTQDIGVKEIRNWHKERGFEDIGYHYVIRRNGQLEEGRPPYLVGAHVKGYNDRSIGVCLVGGIDEKGKPEANFTEAQMNMLQTLITRVKEEYLGILDIKAHHDVAAKACPSFNLSHWLKTGELITSDKG